VTALPTDIIEAMTSPDWWGPWFARGDWSRWYIFLRAVFALPMAAADLEIYRECTGRSDPPQARAKEAYANVGRRGGKTRIMATIAAWLACFEDWQHHLDPGEHAHVLLIAKDQVQARIAFGYVASLICHHPVLHDLVVSETADSLTLSNGVIVRVASASFRGLRGYAVAALLADELAYWFDGDTSANPAEEILNAVRPGMLQFGGRGMLLAGSNPYRRTGPLWDAYRRHHGQPASPVVYWKASTLTMNPLADADEIARAYEEDPAKAAAEYGAEFRTDIEAFVSREVVEAAVVPGRHELPPVRGVAYHAFVDGSSGMGGDAMTFAISHRSADGVAVLDALRGFSPPFSPATVAAECAGVAKAYRAYKVHGDRWGLGWIGERFEDAGLRYEIAENPESDIYREFLAPLNSGKVELLDHPRMIAQLCALERRTARGGRDSVDHPPGSHDDFINAAAGALVLAAAGPPGFSISPEVMAKLRNGTLLPRFRRREIRA
jgi:hypothetical protein